MSGLILIGAVLLGFGMPIAWQAHLSNVFWLEVFAFPVYSLGILCILSDIFHWYEWVQIVLGVPPDKRWRADNQGSEQKEAGG